MASQVIATIFGAILLAAIVAWGIILGRLDRRHPVLRVEPRRPVPWTGWDLLVIFGTYVACSVAVFNVGVMLLGPEAAHVRVIENPGELERSHPVARLVLGGDWLAVAVCAVVAVIVAPVTEEILFRLFLQGWFEKVDRWLRRGMPELGRWFRWGTLPVLVGSVLFALPHFRGQAQEFNRDFFLLLMVGDGIAKSTAVALGIFLARRVRGATWADLGWRADRFFSDAWLGLVVFAAVSIPIYIMQYALVRLLPPGWTPDPIPLFFFALALGTLYLRTHRIVPSIATHIGLNGVSMLVLWLEVVGRRI